MRVNHSNTEARSRGIPRSRTTASTLLSTVLTILLLALGTEVRAAQGACRSGTQLSSDPLGMVSLSTVGTDVNITMP